ncbi:MAG TPA: LppP/LprE family lipoprotein [Acidimicrobiales bacterium]
MRSNRSRRRRSPLTLAGLGVMAALVALASDGQPTRPADAAVGDRSRSIDDIDFTSVAQSGATCDEGVRGATPLLVLVERGASRQLDAGTFARLEVDPDVRVADLDGDGGDEAVVSVVCNYGANGEQHTVQVWTLDGNRPVVVDRITGAPADVARASAFPPAVEGVAVAGDEVVVTFSRHAADDPHCCASQRTEVRYALDGGELVPVGRPVTRPVAG